MIPISTLAAWFVVRSVDDGCPLSNAELQRLCYTAHGIARAAYARRLITEPIEAWDAGPVVPALWREYEHWGDEPITRPSCELAAGPLQPPIQQCVEEAYQRHRDLADWSANRDPHEEPPWCDARTRGNRAELDDSKICDYFDERFHEEDEADGQSNDYTTEEFVAYLKSDPGVQERLRIGRAQLDAGLGVRWDE